MDFSSWKKLKDDGHSCTLVHPKGHTMTIAVKALPKIQQEAIKRLAMADGGRVSNDALASGEGGVSEQGKDVRMIKSMHDVQKRNPNDQGIQLGAKNLAKDYEKSAKDEARGRAKFEREHVKPKMKGLAKGGEVYPSGSREGNEEGVRKQPHGGRGKSLSGHELERGNVENAKYLAKENLSNLKSMPKPKLEGLADGGKVQRYDEGTPDAPVEGAQDAAAQADQAAPDAAQSPIHNGSPIVINVGAAQPQAPVQPPEIPEAQPAPASDSLPQEAQKTLGAVEQQKAAVQGQGEIDAAKAKMNEPIVQENIQAQRDLLASQQKALDNVNQHVDDFNSYMDKSGVINPKHYQENMGSGQKVSTAIGLFLGGLGTPFGGHNYAFDFLNKQIDRDIASQQQNVENKKTVLGAYQQLYGENNAAVLAARATMDHIYAKRIEQTAIQLGTPQAKINAQMGISKLMQDSVEKRHEAAALLSGGVGAQPGVKPQGAKQPTPAPSEHILSPDANDIFKKVKYDPTLQPYAPQIAEQKARADLADKALDIINDKFPELAKNTQGAMGYLHRNGPPILGTLPFVGDAINSGARFATNTPTNRNYDSDYSAIVGAVRGALMGNVAEDLLDRTVKANTPESEDPPELIQRKMRTLKEFIRSHTKTDMLDMAKMTGK